MPDRVIEIFRKMVADYEKSYGREMGPLERSQIMAMAEERAREESRPDPERDLSERTAAIYGVLNANYEKSYGRQMSPLERDQIMGKARERAAKEPGQA